MTPRIRGDQMEGWPGALLARPVLEAPAASSVESKGPRLVPHGIAHYAVLGIVLILALLVRLPQLSGADLGQDGGLSLAIAVQDVPRLLELSARDVHPPLYYLLLHYWTAAFGLSPLGVKSFNLALGLLLVATLYPAGLWMGGRGAGVAAMLLGAISPTLVFSTWAVRDFLMAALLLVVSSLTFVRTTQDGGRGNGLLWLAYTASSALGLLTSYLYAPVLIAQGCHLLLTRRPMRALAPWALSWTAAVVLASPWYWWLAPVPHTLDLLVHSPWPGEDPGSPLATAVAAAQQLAGGHLAAAVAWLLVGWWAYRGSRRDSPTVYLLLAMLLQMGAALLAVRSWLNGPLPMRYTLLVLPFFVLLMASALRRVWARSQLLGAVGLAAIAGSNLSSIADYIQVPPFAYVWGAPDMVRELDSRTGDRDGVVFLSLEQAGYYAMLSPHPRAWQVVVVGQRYLEGNVEAEASRTLAEMAARHHHLWLVMTGEEAAAASSRTVRHMFSQACYPLQELRMGDHHFREYLCEEASGPPQAVGAVFGGRAQLVQARSALDHTPRGVLLVTLTWRALAPVDKDYTVFVHMVDSGGRLVAQHDGPPAEGARPTSGWLPGEEIMDRHVIWLPEGLPPGPYRLLVGLYQGDTRLPVDGGGTYVQVGELRIGGDRNEIQGQGVPPERGTFGPPNL